jgi:hypothetical protein
MSRIWEIPSSQTALRGNRAANARFRPGNKRALLEHVRDTPGIERNALYRRDRAEDRA